MPKGQKQDIAERFSERAQAEKYRDRFKTGRRRRTHERELAALQAALAPLGPFDRLADVGSGPGRFVPAFAAHARFILQMDFSPHMLQVSRQDYSLDAARSAYVQSDARTLPLADDTVDVVFCHRLLNHFAKGEERARAVRELTRISRRYVVVSCLAPPGPIRTLRRFNERLRGRASLDGHVDPEDLLADAQRAGLQLVSRTSIRSLLQSAAFFTFVKEGQELKAQRFTS